jgi:hypothetical protein
MMYEDDVSPALRYPVKTLSESSSHFPEDVSYLRNLCSIL